MRDRSQNVALVALGILITFIALFAYDVVKPRSPADTAAINQIVANAMASATPAPPAAVRVYDTIAPSVVSIDTHTLNTSGKTEGVGGTGVVIDTSGTILTALHVVDKALDIQVTFADGTQSDASIMGQDEATDIAVLRPRQLPPLLIPATLGSPSSLSIGDEAIVVGNPFGIRYTLTAGHISGLNRNFRSPKTGKLMNDLIQFDAAINPGNSGGPLLNRDGEVVGIVTGLINPTDQDVFIGIGFAVPIDAASSAGGPPLY